MVNKYDSRNAFVLKNYCLSMNFTNKLSIEEYLNFSFQSFLFDWLKEVGTTKEELRLGSRENGEQFVMMAGI